MNMTRHRRMHTARALARIAAVVALVMLMTAGNASAQDETYKFDIGVAAGMSGYLGDVNQSNMFSSPGVAAMASFGYLIDTRWNVRGVFTTAGLKGDSSKFSNQFPGGATYKFNSQIYELTARGEFNFLPYGIGETFKRLKRWTPYMGLGIGACVSTAGGQTHFSPTIPMAVGFRFKPAPRLNLRLEFCATYAFGDKLDGNLSDLQGIESAFLKNTDWHTNITIGISYEFGKRCSTCHYKD